MYYYQTGVGYTMRDIRYRWKDGPSSVGMSSEVELPQFRVLGHRQKAKEINLTTGTYKTWAHTFLFCYTLLYSTLHICVVVVVILLCSATTYTHHQRFIHIFTTIYVSPSHPPT